MRVSFLLLLAAFALRGAGQGAPDYSASTLLNAASNRPGPLAPNTIVSLYGTDLSWSTRSVVAEDVRGDRMPGELGLAGVTVIVNGVPAALFYVSPTQINFLLSSQGVPGPVEVRVMRQGVHGPMVRIELGEVSPGLFQLDPDRVVATRPDGTVIRPETPAHPGDIIILYATGLGYARTVAEDRAIPRRASPLQRLSEFRITLDGVAVPADHILYAGVAPNFAGLYQINLRIPNDCPTNPEIRAGYPEAMSPEGLRLPVVPR